MLGTYHFYLGSDEMKKICIIGGDQRQIHAKRILEESFLVDTLGLFSGDKGSIDSSDILLLPVPTTKDGETVFAPFSDKKIYLKEIEAKFKNKLVFCYNFTPQTENFVDFSALDSFALLNAVPTAEGAIKIAVENTPFTLWKSKILVIGYGRVGKILADRLRNLGAFVTNSARSQNDFAVLDAFGFSFINTEKLQDGYLDYDIIFNTVDFTVLDRNTLKNCPCDLIIDLSSKGGFDLEFAKTLGITAIKAGGLPGKVAPKTAGEIIAGTVKEFTCFKI